MIHLFRRSAYLFLSGLMGLLLFFILHRIIVFFYLLFATLSDSGFEYYRFLFWDYVSLSVVMILGAIYGFWVGKYWYRVVYHEQSHGGFVDYINTKLWGEKAQEPVAFQHKLEHVAKKLEDDLSNLEDLAAEIPVMVKPVAIVKRSRIKNPAVKKTSAKGVRKAKPKVKK